MTATLIDTPKLLDADALKFLAGCSGPFITAIVPDRHPGAPEGSRQTVIQALVKTAKEELARGPFASRAVDLLAPIQELAHDPAVAFGGPGLVIFRSPVTTTCYRAPGHVEKVVVANHPHLTPFLADVSIPNDMFVVGLGVKHLRLFRYSHGECVELDLPQGVPVSLEEAGPLRRGEGSLENHSSVGSSAGKMPGMTFGTTSDREAAGEHLLHFFALVDQGLRATLAGKPLLLMGVHVEIQAYRRAARYAHLLETGVDGGAEFLTVTEVGAYAKEAARADYDRRAAAVLAEFREMNDRMRTSKDARSVLRAAAQGRVHRLCVRKDTQVVAQFESGRTKEDLINAAVVETLKNGGEVFELGPDRMTAIEPVAAILRY